MVQKEIGIFFKLNFDVAMNPGTLTAGVGGTIRDNKGKMPAVYSGYSSTQVIQANHPLEAEIQALLQGLIIFQSYGLMKLELEGDCLILV